VFGPGYRVPPPAGPPGGHDTGSRDPAWLGSSAGGVAGKGPVRGFPPAPGQPPPLYPPGQFAAWNRHARPADGEHHGGQPGETAARTSWPGLAGPARGAATVGIADEPGYSDFAVSDPAADVTSTQSWRAVDDSPVPGAWPVTREAAPLSPAVPGPARRPWQPDAPDGDPQDNGAGPHGSGAGPQGAGARPQGNGAVPERPSAVLSSAVLSSAVLQDSGAGPHESGRPGPAAPGGTGTPGTGPHRAGSRGSGTHSSGSRSARTAARKTRRPVTAVLAIIAASVLVIAAVTVLLVISLRHGKSPVAASSARPGKTPTVSASPSPTLGPLGHISTRAADPAPVTIAELYPATFAADGTTFSRTASKLGTHCSDAVVGAALQAKVAAAGCTQVARATYLSTAKLLMGTIGVLNLTSYTAAEQAGHAAGPSAFIGRLPAAKGPTLDIAKGAGIEEAEVKGHYLILVWAGFTNLHAPKYRGEQLALENFMSRLIIRTANVSLTDRMVNGTP